MDNKKPATANPDDNGMSRYYGKPFLVPAEILPETVQKDPTFTVPGEFVTIEGRRFFRISRWHLKK